jgi:DNA-binding MarR family transcriptional regulator
LNHLTLIPAIQRAAHSIAAFLESDPNLPVTQAEAHVLAHLAARGSCTVGQIHAEFGHKRSTLTSILNRLEERGLITCQVNQSDRRSLMIGLTHAGEVLARVILNELLALETEIVSAFSARDQKSALWILTAVKTVVDQDLAAI